MEDDRRFATALGRGLSVLRAFRASDDGLGNAEIAERTGLPKSTVSRLTFTLQSLGYLTHARRSDRYRPGPALLVLGHLADASIPFVTMAAEPMQALADETGTMAMLLVRDGGRMLIVRTWRPRAVASLWLDVGYRVPLTDASSGHALLAALGPEAFRAAVAAAGAERGLTQARAEAVRAEAAGQLATRGFVVADPASYFAPGIHAVSVPFQPRDVPEPVVFTAGALPELLDETRMREAVGPALMGAVRALERMTGQGACRPAPTEEEG
ncbi:IclR family transcriptional regulator [Jannaschia sp. W003]|uniref:IclR family transcriptional regulator n=1 Tax=Jannaschia sp. W003 TaxID=2867012 RepID=UPI0021A37BA0|nr:helix-turn-helix domain-containing protein [Jannaschia sp. W003]UWQ21523.1 helix-turn-helix domain-containing protein [Jannaschia sp. W003]